MTGNGALAAALVLASPAVGSFLAVLADRLPRGEDWITRRSACRACGAAIAPRDLVPLLSYLALRGRCRACGAPIPAALPLAEIGAPAAALAAILVTAEAGGGWPMLLAAVAWLWCLIALALADAAWLRLPDPLTAALALCGLALAAATPGRGLAEAAPTGAATALTLWAVRWVYFRLRGREGLGLGDVKLAAGIGAGLGPWTLPATLLLASGLALAVAAAQALAGRRAALAGNRALPFGLYLCLAAALVWSLAPLVAAFGGSTFAGN